MIFLIIFILVSVIHLYFSWKDNLRGKKMTKPLLMITLLLFYISSAEKIEILIVVALIFGWIGDLLLMSKKATIMHKLGPVAFALGHLCYIIMFSKYKGFNNMPIYAYLVLLIYFIWVYIMIKIIYPCLKDKEPWFFYGGLIYITMIGLMSFFAYSLAWTDKISSIIPFIGSLLFVFSDTAIAYRKFVHKFNKCNFVIIFTYILAQFLIIICFA